MSNRNIGIIGSSLVVLLILIGAYFLQHEYSEHSNRESNKPEDFATDTNEYEIGKLYLVTYAPETEQNRLLGQTATIWEMDMVTGEKRQLLAIEPYINESPHDILPENELRLLEESDFFPPNISERTLMGQGLETISLLSEDLLLVVTYREIREVMYNTAYGYYDFQVLDLRDGGLASKLVVEYHADFVEEIWRCISYAQVTLGRIVPNPASSLFAFSIMPEYERCGNEFVAQSYIVDYSISPAQVEILPFTQTMSWSPDGSMLAYAGIAYPENGDNSNIAIYLLREAAAGAASKTVAWYPAYINYPYPVITWLDDHTIAYQYMDDQTMSENAVWSAYDVNTDQVVFSEELPDGDGFYELDYLYDGESYLIYGWYGREWRLMRYTANSGIIKVQTLPSSHIFSSSKFRQYALLGQFDDPAIRVLKANISFSDFDLSSFVSQGNTVAWIIPGPPNYNSEK